MVAKEMMTFAEILKQMDTVNGCFYAEEARQLYEHTVKLPEGSLVIEAGCLYGRSTSVLATVAKEKNLELYVIDIWVVDGEKVKPVFWEHMKRLGLDNAFHFLEIGSVEASGCFKDDSVDFFHLDTSHDHGLSTRELEVWIPKMKEGGICCFHDYGNPGFTDGIKKAVDVTNLIKIGVYDSLGVFRKGD